jgi:hypothetical protein
METEGSFPCSQQPATGPYPEPDESSPHLSNVITNSIEQSPSWEANSHSAIQKIPPLWNPEVHYRVHNSLPLVPILSRIQSTSSQPN